jgi:demethylmenaquinone methyltransferase/2-methoxy-6-polyprenyl-1,4-benzoquinol methylase
VSVGPEARLSQRRWEKLTISAATKVLDFCSSSRQTTPFLVQYPRMSQDLTLRHYFCNGHPKNVLSANYVEAFAESMPFPDCLFDTSVQQG